MNTFNITYPVQTDALAPPGFSENDIFTYTRGSNSSLTLGEQLAMGDSPFACWDGSTGETIFLLYADFDGGITFTSEKSIQRAESAGNEKPSQNFEIPRKSSFDLIPQSFSGRTDKKKFSKHWDVRSILNAPSPKEYFLFEANKQFIRLLHEIKRTAEIDRIIIYTSASENNFSQFINKSSNIKELSELNAELVRTNSGKPDTIMEQAQAKEPVVNKPRSFIYIGTDESSIRRIAPDRVTFLDVNNKYGETDRLILEWVIDQVGPLAAIEHFAKDTIKYFEQLVTTLDKISLTGNSIDEARRIKQLCIDKISNEFPFHTNVTAITAIFNICIRAQNPEASSKLMLEILDETGIPPIFLKALEFLVHVIGPSSLDALKKRATGRNTAIPLTVISDKDAMISLAVNHLTNDDENIHPETDIFTQLLEEISYATEKKTLRLLDVIIRGSSFIHQLYHRKLPVNLEITGVNGENSSKTIFLNYLTVIKEMPWVNQTFPANSFDIVTLNDFPAGTDDDLVKMIFGEVARVTNPNGATIFVLEMGWETSKGRNIYTILKEAGYTSISSFSEGAIPPSYPISQPKSSSSPDKFMIIATKQDTPGDNSLKINTLGVTDKQLTIAL